MKGYDSLFFFHSCLDKKNRWVHWKEFPLMFSTFPCIYSVEAYYGKMKYILCSFPVHFPDMFCVPSGSWQSCFCATTFFFFVSLYYSSLSLFCHIFKHNCKVGTHVLPNFTSLMYALSSLFRFPSVLEKLLLYTTSYSFFYS